MDRNTLLGIVVFLVVSLAVAVIQTQFGVLPGGTVAEVIEMMTVAVAGLVGYWAVAIP